MSMALFEQAEFGQLRTIADNGVVLFCGKDVTDALGYSNSRDAMARHCKGVVKRYPLETGGGVQQMAFITEGDLYRLIVHSKLPTADKFERWVFDEVLPAIRRRGGYLTPEAAEQALTDPDFIIRLATELKTERAARAELEQQQRVLAPKADAFDLWLSSNADYSVDQAAKALCTAGCMTGRTRLFRTLSELGWAFKARDGWRYTQEHGPEGTKRLTVRMSYYLDSHTAESHGRTTLRVTAKGVHDLATRLGVNPATVADTLTTEEVAS